MKKGLLYSALIFLGLSVSQVDAQDLSFDSGSLTAGDPANGNSGSDLATGSGITISQIGVEAKVHGSTGVILEVANNNNNLETTMESIQITSANNIGGFVLNLNSNAAANTAQPYVAYYASKGGVLLGCDAHEGGGPSGYQDVLYTAPLGTKFILITRVNGTDCNGTAVKQQTFRVKRIDVYSEGTPLPNLPLDFLSVSAKAVAGGVDLAWSTTNEVNTQKFVVEKATDNSDFASIGEVASKNAAGVHNYSFTDAAASGNAYYRIKQVDNDGAFTYSAVVTAKGTAAISVYPNPAQDKITVAGAQGGAVKVLSLDGKVVATSASSTVDVSALSAGVYVVVYENAGEQVSTKFVKK